MAETSSYRDFLKSFSHLFVPAFIQFIFFNLIGIFDVLMIGQLGDAPVAAVGLAGQIYFLLNLALFGIGSGCAVLGAQYWGARDQRSLHRILGICLATGLGVGLIFALLALIFPTRLIGIFTQDPLVIQQAAAYLQIIGWAYLVLPISSAYYNLLRSIGNTRLPMAVSVVCLSLNILLDYSLIFGRFGLPALGMRGAALGTAIARVLECASLITLVYWRRLPLAASIKQMASLNWSFFSHHIRTVVIVFLNEFLWAMGINAYNVIFAHLGTQPYAAYNIANSINSIGLCYSMAVMSTCGIMVGNAVGAGEKDLAFTIGRRAIWLNLAGSCLMGVIIFLVRDPIMTLYQVSAQTRQDATGILVIVGSLLWLRSLDGLFVVGILRSGGDTRFSALLDVGAIWLAGVPAAAAAAFIFHLPVPLVFMAMYTENLVKNVFGLRRFLTRRWMHNITQAPLAPEGVII
jgi:putative MATE family efflux protein